MTREGPCHDPGLGQHLRVTRESDCYTSTDIVLAQNARIVNIDQDLPQDIQIHTCGAIILGQKEKGRRNLAIDLDPAQGVLFCDLEDDQQNED